MADDSLTKQICPVTQNIQVMRQLLLSLCTFDTIVTVSLVYLRIKYQHGL